MFWNGRDSYGGHFGMMYVGSAVAWLMMILLVALLVTLVVGAVLLFSRTSLTGRSGEPPGTGVPPGHDQARQILDERLARGEIDEDEYLRCRATMGRD